jgi:methyl-accepting chemotaxis protein
MPLLRNMKISLRVILSFGATGVILILLALLFRGKLEQNSRVLSVELARYRDLDQTCRELYTLSFEIESAAIARMGQSGRSAEYQSLSTRFNQDLSTARSESSAEQLPTLDEVSSLWEKIQLDINHQRSAPGGKRQSMIDSIRARFAAVESKLAAYLSASTDEFFVSHSREIENIASMKDEVSYISLLLIVALTLVGFLWYRSLTAPLRALMQATRRIANDEWGARVELDSRDEFGKLGQSFNEMSANTARLAASLNAVCTPVYTVDRNYTLRFANTAALKFAGVRREDVILKKKCHEVFNLPLCQTEDCPISKAWNGQRLVAGETVSRLGDPIPVLYQASAVDELSGPDARAVEVLTDITEMKRVTAEIEEQRKYLTAAVNRLLEKMTDFANGDLTINLEVETSDDIGKLYDGLKKSIRNITTMMEELIDAVESTASASSQISSSIEELAAGVSQQSAQANDVAASVEQMARSVADNARSASRVEQAARENGKVAQSGGEIVQRTVVKIKEIADVVKKSSETVDQLGDLSKQISEIVSVIGDIADQTNLLALNAAIEAARAGEEGKGFAVVADEVRKLAERTTQATKQISAMIKNIQSRTGEAVDAMRNGIQEVDSGIVLADEAGASLKEIVDNAHGIVDMISQIAAANEEQSSTSGEISKNVEMISTVSSQSANGISQIAGAADDLNRMTTNLQTLISRFKLNKERVGHKNGPSRVRPGPVSGVSRTYMNAKVPSHRGNGNTNEAAD